MRKTPTETIFMQLLEAAESGDTEAQSLCRVFEEAEAIDALLSFFSPGAMSYEEYEAFYLSEYTPALCRVFEVYGQCRNSQSFAEYYRERLALMADIMERNLERYFEDRPEDAAAASLRLQELYERSEQEQWCHIRVDADTKDEFFVCYCDEQEAEDA